MEIQESYICDDINCLACKYDARNNKPKDHTGKVETHISCSYISFGDYDNSCAVERANVRYLEENHQTDIAYIHRGAYGWEQVWLYDTPENRELLESLGNYPCFDDTLVSDIELEIENEYLQDNSSDLIRLLPESVQDACDVLVIDFDIECYEKAKESSNSYFQVEAGGNGYIDFKRIAKDYSLALCDKYPTIKIISELKESLTLPPFPVDFYESLEDMAAHKAATFAEYTPEEIKAVVAHAVSLEKIISEVKI